MAKSRVFAAVDLGGTNTILGLLSEKGEVLERLEVPTAVEDGYDDSYEEQRGYLEYLVDGLSGLPAEVVIDVPDEGSPVLNLALDEEALGRTAYEVAHQLKNGDPRVFVQETGLAEAALVVNPINLNQARTEALAEALRQVLKS